MTLKYQLLQAPSLYKGQVRGRYAPSPSGVQHLGNIRTALLTWLQVRLVGGEFILRMDDLDTPRVRPGSAAQILADLRWLGMDWDRVEGIDYATDADCVYVQSASLRHYQQALLVLKNQGKVFPCDCSRKQIADLVGKPHAGGHYVYPGTCREREMTSFSSSRQYAWRFLVEDELICFDDVLMGAQSQHVAREMGDFVLKRRDGVFAYQLASVVDDIDMGVTDVVRGADLLVSTPAQIALFRALGATPPRFWHVPLKTDTQGNKLAKRDGADSLQRLRDAGVTAKQIIGSLAFELGLVDDDKPIELRVLLDGLKL